MEYDRYQEHSKLYLFGILCLLMCLFLLFFSLYLVPYLIWDLHYNVPDLISTLIVFFQEHYYVSNTGSKILVWLLFFIPSLVTGILSYYVSNFIDSKVLHVESETDEEQVKQHSAVVKKVVKESVKLGFKILSLMIMIVLVILLLQIMVKYTSLK